MASLLQFIVVFVSIFAIAISKTFPSDIEALKSFKSSIDASSIPPSSCLSSWDFAFDPCDAAFSSRFTCGLRCDLTASDNLSRVTDLSLDPAGYSGPLPPSIWSLSSLQTLDLADNRFSGELPPPPPAVPTLRRLSLSRNILSGEIPILSAAASLEEVYLDNNFFSGAVKIAAFSNLERLQRLELQGNNLTGEIPDLSSLSSLNYLDASDNALTGEFPSIFPPNIVEISLRNNRLSGDLPGPTLSALESLQVLDLGHNGLSGPVPGPAFGHPALQQLTLSYNQFHRLDPPSDGSSVARSELVALDVSHNVLTGMLPGFIGSMPRLSALDLGYNKFTGMIPVSYAMRVVGVDEGEGMARFGRMVLAGNYLFGPIPAVMMRGGGGGGGGEGEGDGEVSLKDNCLFRCPAVFFFCEDGMQKPFLTCREFNPVIP